MAIRKLSESKTKLFVEIMSSTCNVLRDGGAGMKKRVRTKRTIDWKVGIARDVEERGVRICVAGLARGS